MKTILWTKDTAWDDVLRQSEAEEVLVLRDGHAVALLVPFDDEDVEWYARERDPSFVASIAEARRQVGQGQTLSQSELRTQLGLE